ncbi:MAG: type II toxin-antitoxin system PemK/MazF family toxin [Betaproteobacteria bacterium]
MGHKQKGTGPALVLTPEEFNRLGDVLVASITQGDDFSRYAGFAVSLTGSGCKTQGAALVNKIRMLDLAAGKARRIESFPLVLSQCPSPVNGEETQYLARVYRGPEEIV